MEEFYTYGMCGDINCKGSMCVAQHTVDDPIKFCCYCGKELVACDEVGSK